MFYRIECLVHDLRRRLDSVRHYLQGHFPVSANGDSYWAAAIHSEDGKLFIDLAGGDASIEIDLSSNVLITRS